MGPSWIELHPIAASQGPDCRGYRIGVDQSAGDANIEHRPLSSSPNETLWNIGSELLSLRLDVGRDNHLAPFFGLVGDELAKISGQASKHRAAQIGKPCFEFWICNADIDFLVQSFDELCGRALRSTNAEPCTCLVVRQRVAQNRNVRQHIRPRRGGYGQGAEFAAPDIFDR